MEYINNIQYSIQVKHSQHRLWYYADYTKKNHFEFCSYIFWRKKNKVYCEALGS